MWAHRVVAKGLRNWMAVLDDYHGTWRAMVDGNCQGLLEAEASRWPSEMASRRRAAVPELGDKVSAASVWDLLPWTTNFAARTVCSDLAGTLLDVRNGVACVRLLVGDAPVGLTVPKVETRLLRANKCANSSFSLLASTGARGLRWVARSSFSLLASAGTLAFVRRENRGSRRQRLLPPQPMIITLRRHGCEQRLRRRKCFGRPLGVTLDI
jgi:hypothetical protein